MMPAAFAADSASATCAHSSHARRHGTRALLPEPPNIERKLRPRTSCITKYAPPSGRVP